eukprot:10280543-Karenia_brevis.AAC.1
MAMLVHFSLNLGRLMPNRGPTWRQLGLNLTPTWSNLASTWSQLGTTWPNVAPAWPQLAPNLA